MSEKDDRPTRGRIAPDLDVPAAQPGARCHDEWLIDESIEETFPASDAPVAVHPGSTAALGSRPPAEAPVGHDDTSRHEKPAC